MMVALWVFKLYSTVPALQRKILPPISGWLNLFIWMLQLLALDGGKWSASHPGCFCPQERAHGTHWQNSLVKQAKKKILTLLRKNPIQPHSTDTVLTVIMVADREETSEVLVQSTLWHGMVQQVFLTEVGILWNRKSLSIGDLTPLFPLQLNLTLYYKKSHNANLLLLRWLAPSKIFSTMETVPKNQQLLFDYTLSVTGGGRSFTQTLYFSDINK
jgi:hypothetical protein